MKERSVFLTRDQSLILRGIAIIMVMASHYVVWYMDFVTCEPIRYAVSRLGVYGVDLFFLVSGYGLSKSAQKNEVGARYVRSRLQSTYFPYLLIAAAIALLSHDEWTLESVYFLLTGYQYWFIRNILVFYLAFFLVFRLTKKRGQRAAMLFLILLGYCGWLTYIGRASFWIVSNLSFGIGVLAALYEERFIKAANTAYPVWLAVLALFMALAAKNGMDVRFTPIENCDKILPGTAASAVWTILCLQGACLLRGRLDFLKRAGSVSLELYLLHQVIYNLAANEWSIPGRLSEGIISIALTAMAAWLIHFGLSRLWAVWDKKAGKQ